MTAPHARPHRAAATVTLCALALLCLAPSGASGQPSMSGVITGAFDHVEKSVATTEDASTAPAGTLDFEHLAFEERLRLFYTMDGGTFSGDGDWHYLTHYGGARHAFDLSPDARLFVGGTATVRVNGDSWSTANYNAVGGFANLQWSRGTSTLRAGTRVDARRFADEAALDQNELNVFGSVLRSFQTRTTVVGEITWGAKRFTNGALVTVQPLATETGATDIPAGAGPNGGAAGNGRGNGGAGVSATGHTGAQAAMWRLPMSSSSTSNDAATQVTVFGRVAQSLADRVAISFEASRRNAGGVVAPAVVETPEMLIDDGVYDDPYASDATIWRTGLKYSGPSGRILEGGFSRWLKFYEATPALDASGTAIPGVLRDDRIWRADVIWREPIAPGRTGLASLAFVTTYSFMDSSSTDAYYNYDAHRLRVGVSVTY